MLLTRCILSVYGGSAQKKGEGVSDLSHPPPVF
jgi:hypothetical protein